MAKSIKLISAFYLDPFRFKPGQRVLIGHQTGALVVLRPVLVSGRLAGDMQIEYVKIDDGKYADMPNFPLELLQHAHVALVCSSTGDVDVLKARDRRVPYQGHAAITVVRGTLWDHYRAGALPTVNMDLHLDFVEMRTIARAVLSEGPKMVAVCGVLGVTRHCLRRRLTKFGMPELAEWREKLADWRVELSEFARGGNQGKLAERSDDPDEQFIAAERDRLNKTVALVPGTRAWAAVYGPDPHNPVTEPGIQPAIAPPDDGGGTVLPFHRGGPFHG